MISIKDFENMTRRASILKLVSILEDEEQLRETAGKSFLIDAALFMVAKNDARMLDNLNSVLNTYELSEDIGHCINSNNLKKLIGGVR